MEDKNIPFKVLSKDEVYALDRQEKANYFKKLGAQVSVLEYLQDQENDAKRIIFKSFLSHSIACILIGCLVTFALVAILPITASMLDFFSNVISQDTQFRISSFIASTQIVLYQNPFTSFSCLSLGIAFIPFSIILIRKRKISYSKKIQSISKDDLFFKELVHKTSSFLDDEFLNSDAIQTMATYFSNDVAHNVEVAKHLYRKEKQGFVPNKK